MFIVCTGALQSIPADVREAAHIDGASAFRMLRSIIMPLLLVAVGPLLIASFAFNFNNFSADLPLHRGRALRRRGNTSDRSTDLLITYAYRLAFSGVTPELRLRGRSVDPHLHPRRSHEHSRLPSHQGPGGDQLMTVVNRFREASPSRRQSASRSTASPPSRRRRDAPGGGVWWRHAAGHRRHRVGALPDRLHRARRRINPSGTLNTAELLPTRMLVEQLRRAVQRPGAAVHVLVPELDDRRRRRLARARSSSARARRTPSRGCASPAVARACSSLLLFQMFPALLAFVALYITFDEIGDVLPAIGLNSVYGLILAYLGGAMGANVWLLKGYFDTVPARARRGGQGRRSQPRPDLLHHDAAPGHADPGDGLHARRSSASSASSCSPASSCATSTARPSASGSTAMTDRQTKQPPTSGSSAPVRCSPPCRWSCSTSASSAS